MIQYLYIGGGLLALAALTWAMWFAYRSGKSAASIAASQTSTDAATVATRKAEAMAQAEANKPSTEDTVLIRLDEGTS
ncbi:hypothetical protein [Neokomagataea anthophila]|uniref:Pilus assembly protein n=1 Tax=Neokomagataea anthophila TaxID=2826925 RepID=A0ABS5E896_9PROT|nr:hypothetical protein [Neokomagataea anthophila]MBR0560026.1 hypothetical protein [Neokomagataea anthophila]